MSPSEPRSSWLIGLGVLLLAVAMTYVFWQPLWGGTEGFIGGDMYPYFYPQKTFLADRLTAGEFPLWNNLVGQGYPVVAESQTGLLYPTNLLLYRLFDVQLAYNLSHLLHAVLAFVGTWLLARRLGLTVGGALVTALVFVYGWFPARACLEWAMIGGAWFPLVLWGAESWLQTRRARWLLVTAFALALFLLGGHFHLAFITLVATVGYALIRPAASPSSSPSPATPTVQATTTNTRWFRDRAAVAGAIVVGFLLVAAQLLPTLELRGRSQRFEFSSEHNPLYGRIPLNYLSHIVAPWLWFRADVNRDEFLGGSNQVEAHLYCGLIPIVLALGTALVLIRRRTWTPVAAWLVLGLLFLALATGWPLVWLKALPGFGFFRGAGRYGMVTAFAIALTAGWGLETLLARQKLLIRFAVIAACLATTTYDLLRVVPSVSYASIVPSPLALLDKSEVRKILAAAPQARVFGPGQNVLTIAGVSQLPVYLGIGPAEYFENGSATLSSQPDPKLTDAEIADRVAWLRQGGVTHLLGQKPWDTNRWPLRLVWQDFDQLFNRAWGQYQDPLYLYEILDAPGRVVLAEGAAGTATVAEYGANRVALTANLTAPGRVVLKDLLYPGWAVTVDDQPATVEVDAKMFRAVDVPAGEHRIVWSYRPRSFYTGAAISLVTLLVVAAGGLWARRRAARKIGKA